MIWFPIKEDIWKMLYWINHILFLFLMIFIRDRLRFCFISIFHIFFGGCKSHYLFLPYIYTHIWIRNYNSVEDFIRLLFDFLLLSIICYYGNQNVLSIPYRINLNRFCKYIFINSISNFLMYCFYVISILNLYLFLHMILYIILFYLF